MNQKEIIEYAINGYIPQEEGIAPREAEEDCVSQLLWDAFSTYTMAFGNSISSSVNWLRMMHEEADIRVVGADEPWICGYDIETERKVELGFSSPDTARTALIVLLRKAMSDAFECYDMTRAVPLREILDQLKSEDLEISETGWSGGVFDLGEYWFIRKNSE